MTSMRLTAPFGPGPRTERFARHCFDSTTLRPPRSPVSDIRMQLFTFLRRPTCQQPADQRLVRESLWPKQREPRRPWFAALSLLLCLAGCSVPESSGERDFVDLVPDGEPGPAQGPRSGQGPDAQPHSARTPIEARSVQGKPLRVRILGDSGPCLLLLGAIHGDEPGSHELVRDFETWLRAHPIETRGLRLVICSPLNPDGLEAGTRLNARGIDLNRNFPSKNFQASARRGQAPLSEPESRYLAKLLETYKPALVITVHQPRRSVNWDGPAEGLARAMARLNGYRPEATVGYSTPGSLGSWVGIDQQIPILTLELPRKPGPKGSFFEENRRALILAMASLRTMPPPATRSDRTSTTPHISQ